MRNRQYGGGGRQISDHAIISQLTHKPKTFFILLIIVNYDERENTVRYDNIRIISILALDLVK